MIWVTACIFAAFFQTIRTALQKKLKADLSNSAINWIRYSFGLPFVLFYVWFLVVVQHYQLPTLSFWFVFHCVAAGISQILGTGLLILLFSKRNFAIGTTYAKTESLQTALFGLLIFSEKINFIGWLAIFTGSIGVMLISLTKKTITLKNMLKGVFSKTAFTGIASGMAFSFSGLFVRQATLSIEGGFIINAGVTLLFVITIQFFFLGAWIFYQNKKCFYNIGQKWQLCLLTGIFSALGSVGWFTAFAIANAAYVKTIGQIELLFSIIISRYIFKEHVNKTEVLGMMLILLSIIFLFYFLYWPAAYQS